MNVDDDRAKDHEFDAYGPWGWIGGFVFGGLLLWFMFALATGFA